MPYSLKNRNVLVTGASSERGLGAIIAKKFAIEGSNVAIHYNSSAERAKRVAENIEKEHSVKTIVLQGDTGKLEDCERLVQEAIDGLGGLDIIVSNAGWTKFTESGEGRFGDLDFMTEQEWDKSWAVNCKAQLHLLRKALPTFNANPDGGAFLLTSSVAGVSAYGSTMAYSVTKAAGLHLVKCLASTQGPKVRVNAILPGLILTEWGEKFSRKTIESCEQKSFLGKTTDVEDCADAFISVAKNGSMTGQNIQIDSGLAMLGRSG
ncbi:hypothetical protein N7G274_004761 [Stereocaulon virgatum]|uniref:Uncharacterized protein n=1 Tax=Stereocaulon virgatum TaxID=373712 RepID=A0ABR4AB35_9LECA